MKRMDSREAKLDALFAEYRAALPDIEGSTGFGPELWRRIEAKRNESIFAFRHFARIWVVAAAAVLALIAVANPLVQSDPALYSASYVDVLDNAHSGDSVAAAADGEI